MITQANYWKEVKDIVEELHAEVKAGRVTDTDQATEWLHETVDGHEWIIYTTHALEILPYTEHDEDAFELGGDALAGCESAASVYTRLAYHGLLGDVMDEAGDLEKLFTAEEDES